jgi:hypothetical protein
MNGIANPRVNNTQSLHIIHKSLIMKIQPKSKQGLLFHKIGTHLKQNSSQNVNFSSEIYEGFPIFRM